MCAKRGLATSEARCEEMGADKVITIAKRAHLKEARRWFGTG